MSQRWSVIYMLIASLPAAAQTRSLLGSEFDNEGREFKKDCSGFTSVASCAQLLFTGTPLRLTAGSVAPQNGVGFGPAFVFDPDLHAWRLNLNIDAVVTPNQS